jgi:hypothetical protein
MEGAKRRAEEPAIGARRRAQQPMHCAVESLWERAGRPRLFVARRADAGGIAGVRGAHREGDGGKAPRKANREPGVKTLLAGAAPHHGLRRRTALRFHYAREAQTLWVVRNRMVLEVHGLGSVLQRFWLSWLLGSECHFLDPQDSDRSSDLTQRVHTTTLCNTRSPPSVLPMPRRSEAKPR